MEERWQVIGIVKRKSKSSNAIYTTLYLIGNHTDYDVDNAEVCQGSRCIAETTSAQLPPVTIGDTIELLYGKGFEGKAVLKGFIVTDKNPVAGGNNAKK